VHVITVPKRGAPEPLLWERFGQAFGLDLAALHATTDRSNPSLGVAETALLRRLNERVNGGVLANEHYREFVRELLAHRTLSRRSGAPRLQLPDDVRAWAVALNDTWLEELGARGYDVIGSLDDLRPDPAASGDADLGSAYLDPDDPPLDQLTDAALTSLVALLQEAAALRGEVTRLHEDLGRTSEERDWAYRQAGLGLRARRAILRRADTSRVGRVAHRAYRRARGRPTDL
jgi:hypothetical protein